MNFHPVIAASIALDAAAGIMAAGFAITQIRIVLGWQTAASTKKQLDLEKRAQTASVVGRAALAAYAVGGLVAVVAATTVLPAFVPGAMCGAGVFHAPNGGMARAFAMRLLALAALWAWQLLDRLNRSAPASPLAVQTARTGLLAIPFLALAVKDHLLALAALGNTGPVDCCSVLYKKIGAASRGPTEGPWLGDAHLIWLYLIGSVLLVSLAVYAAFTHRRRKGPVFTACVALALVVWTGFAAKTSAAVYYALASGASHHACPFCLFKLHRNAAGFFIYGGLIAVLLQGMSVLLSSLAAHRVPQIAPEAAKSIRSALFSSAVAVALVTLATMRPTGLW